MLKINYVTLENFGPITQKKKVTFDSGFNVIWAKNGSGKTKTFTAIEMMLIDEYKGSFEDYINWNSDFFNLELSFDFNDSPYFMTLNCSKNKNTVSTERKIYKGDNAEGNPIASGDEAKEYLSKLLDKAVVQYALMVKQSTEDHIVDCKDAERRDLIQKIKGIDYSSRVEKEIDPKIKVLGEEIEVLDKEIYALQNKNYDPRTLLDLPFSDEEVKEFTSKVEVLKAQLTSYEQGLSIYTKNTTDRDDLEKKINNLKNVLIVSKRNSLTDIKNKIDSLKTEGVSKKEQDYELALQRENDYYTEKLKEFTEARDKRLSEFQEKKTELEIENKELLEKISLLQVLKLPKFNDTELLLLNKTLSIQEEKKNRCLKDKELVASGVCPTCNQDCTHLVENYDIELGVYDETISQLNSKIAEIELAKKTYEQKIEENNKLKEDREKLSQTKLELDSKINTLVVEHESKLEQGETWRKSKEEAHENILKALLKELDTAKNQIKTDIENLSNQAKDLTVDINNYENSLIDSEVKKAELDKWFSENIKPEQTVDKSEIKTLEENIKQVNDIKSRNAEILKFNKEIEEQKSKDKVKLKELEDKKQESLNSKLSYETARNILLKEFPSFIIDSSVEEIEEAMNQFITNIYYKDLGISLRPTKTSLKLEYGMGKNKKPAHLLSGAERKITDIAFKNNYNNLAELSCILLDEPDAALDSTNKLALFEALTEMVDIYNQVIVVSHNKEMVEFLKNNSLECNIIQF